MYKRCEVILKELENENKIKVWWDFKFPEKQELKLRLKDILEDEVDEKYYLSDKTTDFFIYNEQKQIEKGNGFRFNVTDGNVIAKTITTRAGGRMDDNFIGNKELYIKNATKKGYLEATEGDGIDISSRMKYHRGNVQKGMIQTLDCQGGNSKGVVDSELRIRKLTPLECWRLMGFDDEDFEKAEKVNSNTQLYKQARKLDRRQCIRKNIRKFISRREK